MATRTIEHVDEAPSSISSSTAQLAELERRIAKSPFDPDREGLWNNAEEWEKSLAWGQAVLRSIRGSELVGEQAWRWRRVGAYAAFLLRWAPLVDGLGRVSNQQLTELAVVLHEQVGLLPDEKREVDGDRRRGVAHMLSVFVAMRKAFLFIRKNVVGDGSVATRIRQQLWLHAIGTADRFDANPEVIERLPVLLIGPTGSGKTLAARALGQAVRPSVELQWNGSGSRIVGASVTGPKEDKVFASVNMATIANSLADAELFGIGFNVATGVTGRHGMFGQGYATLFLDELGELPRHVQAKLLGVLQDGRFRRVGEAEERKFTGRVIAAMAKKRGLRADLAFRLGKELEFPSLAERLRPSGANGAHPESLETFVRHFVRLELAKPEEAERVPDASEPPPITGEEDRVRDVMQSLPENYGWPGNLRELELAVRALVAGAPWSPAGKRRTLAADAPCSDLRAELAKAASEIIRRELAREKLQNRAAKNLGIDVRNVTAAQKGRLVVKLGTARTARR
jgi:hypothetical protein